MKYTINQIGKETAYIFMDFNFANKHNFSFNDYNKTYEGAISNTNKTNMALLGELYEMFNINHPKDFTGHSLSVSDIVILEDDNKNATAYYCDSFGWKDITSCIYNTNN